MYSISIYCCKLWWTTISWFDSISFILLEHNVCTILVNANKLKSATFTCTPNLFPEEFLHRAKTYLVVRGCWKLWRKKTFVYWFRTVKYFLDSAESSHMIQKSYATTRSCQLSINSSRVFKAIKYIKIWKARKLRTFWELKLFCYSSVHNFAAAVTAILPFFSSS